MPIAKGAVSVIAIVVVTAACKTEETNPESTYPSRFADALCSSAFEACCRANELGFDSGNCKLGAAGFVQSGVDAARRAGAVFDENAANECIAAAAEAVRTCSGLGNSPACARVYVGKKALGESCNADVECAPGAGVRGYCVGASLDGKTAGKCTGLTASAKVGDACGTTDQTPPSTLADCESSGLQCDLSRTCQPLTASGAKCGALSTCEKGTTCGGSGTCEATLAAGSACTTNAQCSAGACIHGKCAQNGLGTPTPCTGEK